MMRSCDHCKSKNSASAGRIRIWLCQFSGHRKSNILCRRYLCKKKKKKVHLCKNAVYEQISGSEWVETPAPLQEGVGVTSSISTLCTPVCLFSSGNTREVSIPTPTVAFSHTNAAPPPACFYARLRPSTFPRRKFPAL